VELYFHFPSCIYGLQWNYIKVTFTPLRENGVVTPYAGGSSEMDKEI